MKIFTFKDFIAYNNPCFSCGDKINFSIVSCPITEPGKVQLRPTVRPDSVTVDLKISYNQSLQLQILMPSNQFLISDRKAFADYIFSNRLYLNSHCNRCFTTLETHFLEFNFDKGFIKPVGMSRESLVVSDNTHRYHIYSSFFSEKSTIVMDRIDRPIPISPVKFEAPLLPLYRFRDREHFITKMKTYLIFL